MQTKARGKGNYNFPEGMLCVANSPCEKGHIQKASFSWTNSSGFLWKHASLSSSPAGQSLYELHKPPRGSEADEEAGGLLHSLAPAVVVANLPRDDSLADRALPHDPRGHLGQVAAIHPVVRVWRRLVHSLLRHGF